MFPPALERKINIDPIVRDSILTGTIAENIKFKIMQIMHRKQAILNSLYSLNAFLMCRSLKTRSAIIP